MIKSVAFKDFRGLDELTIPLSSATMLTGTNGAGKTSVLEGLFCLFSHSKLDVSFLSRYNKTIELNVNQAANLSPVFFARQSYNYKLFWDECPSYGNSMCSVEASADDGFLWSWNYKRAKISDLDGYIIAHNLIPIDDSSDFALWKWNKERKLTNEINYHNQIMNEACSRAQILTPGGGLYLLPSTALSMSICHYIDFAFMRYQPKRLSFHTAKELTKALKLIEPHITDVRLTDIESGLSVILNGKNEISLAAIGNGAVTWASVMMTIFDMTEITKHQRTDIPKFILIDEMGAGIHYSIMLDIWKFLCEFIHQYNNIQFVFTSHSDDCIRAFCEAFNGQDDTAIVRLHKTSDEKKIATTEYKKESFQNIIDGVWEVRG